MRRRLLFGIATFLFLTAGILFSQGVTGHAIENFCCYDKVCLERPDCTQPSHNIASENVFLGAAALFVVATTLVIRLRHHD